MDENGIDDYVLLEAINQLSRSKLPGSIYYKMKALKEGKIEAKSEAATLAALVHSQRKILMRYRQQLSRDVVNEIENNRKGSKKKGSKKKKKKKKRTTKKK